MPSILILALPIVIYLSLCRLPRAPGTLYTIGIMFLLAQGLIWLEVFGASGTAIVGFVQVGIVIAGLVQGLRLMVLPAEASRGRYVALVVGGVLIGAALVSRALGA